MFNTKKLAVKIICTIVYLAFVYMMYITNCECIYLKFLGIQCPGCGMTRAWVSVINRNVVDAFSFNPMFWSVPILYIFILADGHIFKNNYVNYSILALICIGFIILFLFRLLNPVSNL